MSTAATTGVTYESAKTPRTRTLPPTRGRSAILLTMLVAFVAAMLFQWWAYSFRAKAVSAGRPQGQGAAAPSRLANLDSFSLALLLGGLRGPLVMFLWTSSETQKSEKDLESFDTQVEMIRLLQPEFATVHLFQMWNKAYNVSVQMASLANKYAAILDAIRYGEVTDRANPDDINILSSIGSLYADKLGNSTEKDYYRKRVRGETLPVYRVAMPAGRTDAFKKAVTQAGLDASRLRITVSSDGQRATAVLEKLPGDRVKAAFNGPDIQFAPVARQTLRGATYGGRRTEMDTLLDAQGYILPQYLKSADSQQGGPDARAELRLDHLTEFQPFPYGLSPIALGYNYFRRSQIVQATTSQRHIQISELVVDAQPAMSLEAWSREEFDRGRKLEYTGLAKSRPDADKLSQELRTASLGPDAQVADPSDVREAAFSYDRTARIVEAALPEFQHHIERFPQNSANYQSHVDGLRALSHLAQADAAVLKFALANKDSSAADRQKLIEQARTEYREAGKWYRVMILGYYTEEEDAKTIGYERQNVSKQTPEQLKALQDKVYALIAKRYGSLNRAPSQTDRQEYDENLSRIDQRLKILGGGK
jgi:hypothetical protein